MKELLSNVGAGGAAPAAGAAPGAAAGGAAAAEAPKEEEKKEEEKEESDDDMVRPLLLSARPRAGFADWACVCVYACRASVCSTKRVERRSASYVLVALVFIVSHSSISHALPLPPYCVVLSMSHLLRMPKTLKHHAWE